MQRILAIFILIIALPFCAIAKDSDPRIGVVDIDRVINDSSVYKALQVSIEKQNSKYQEELKSYESKIIALDKEISQTPSILPQEQIDKLKVELAQYETEAQKMVQKRRMSLDNAFSKAMEQIKSELFAITTRLAQEKNLQLLLPKSQILYNNAHIEFTEQALLLLNTSLPNVNVVFEE